ncbi:hypothetical protein KC356_g255 [Hortaea werneckii]|nr:hypothetical protein KC356_g255 [Hortaea werneckii]
MLNSASSASESRPVISGSESESASSSPSRSVLGLLFRLAEAICRCTSTGNCRPSACTIGGAPSLNRRGFSAKSLTRSTDNARKHSDEDVGIHASFMRFIEDDGGVLRQNEVLTDLTEQNTVGHELDGRLTVDIGIVADLMCDPAFVRPAELGCDALCNGYRSDTPRLSDSYHAFTLHSSRFIRRLLANMRTIPTLEHHLWNLSGLA